jgi:hypothetical protein
VIIPEPRTPADKHECIAAAQAFYVQAENISRRIKRGIPQEFERVIAKLDELCGEEEFEKARTSIDWMNICLQNLTNNLGYCTRNEAYFCGIDPESDDCTIGKRRAEH